MDHPNAAASKLTNLVVGTGRAKANDLLIAKYKVPVGPMHRLGYPARVEVGVGVAIEGHR